MILATPPTAPQLPMWSGPRRTSEAQGFLGGQGAASAVRVSLASFYLVKVKVKDCQLALQTGSERYRAFLESSCFRDMAQQTGCARGKRKVFHLVHLVFYNVLVSLPALI